MLSVLFDGTPLLLVPLVAEVSCQEGVYPFVSPFPVLPPALLTPSPSGKAPPVKVGTGVRIPVGLCMPTLNALLLCMHVHVVVLADTCAC